MSKERFRSIKTAQLKMRELNILLEGSSGTPAISGFDQYQVSVTDLGVGNYKVSFNNPFERNCALGGFGLVTAGVASVVVTAVAEDSITIQCDSDLIGTPVDCDLYLCIKGSDARYDV